MTETAFVMQAISQARVSLERGDIESASSLASSVLAQAARHVEALDIMLRCSVRRGHLKDALLHLETLLSVTPMDVKYHVILGQVLNKLCEQPGYGDTLRTVLDRVPFAYSTRLMFARFLELAGLSADAVRHYLIAIRSANALGFWHNEASTAPWCRSMVVHALNMVDKGRIDLLYQWLEPLWQQFGKVALVRVTKAMQMYVGEIPLVIEDKRQSPSFLYIPDLPVSPVFDRTALVFADEYESRSAEIKAEVLSLLASHSSFQPFQEGKAGEELTTGGRWDAYFFARHGQQFLEHHQACPKTSAALSQLPLVNIADHAPEVCFSIMQPGTHILPHRGVTNSRAVLHMGLVIPPECRLNLVDITTLTWQEGKIFAFDDTYLHEAWNRSHQPRVVLLSDIWNPYLHPQECIALTDLIEKIGIFNQATAAIPYPQ